MLCAGADPRAESTLLYSPLQWVHAIRIGRTPPPISFSLASSTSSSSSTRQQNWPQARARSLAERRKETRKRKQALGNNPVWHKNDERERKGQSRGAPSPPLPMGISERAHISPHRGSDRQSGCPVLNFAVPSSSERALTMAFNSLGELHLAVSPRPKRRGPW